LPTPEGPEMTTGRRSGGGPAVLAALEDGGSALARGQAGERTTGAGEDRGTGGGHTWGHAELRSRGGEDGFPAEERQR